MFRWGLQFTIGGSQISDVNDYVHLGHHISANLDDKSDILSRSRSLCCKINNVLCQFSNCDPFVKLRLLCNFAAIFVAAPRGIWHNENKIVSSVTRMTYFFNV